MLVRGSSIRDITYTLQISTGFVLRALLSYYKTQLAPNEEHYDQVQVDELYSFVGNKKDLDFVCLLSEKE
ncbi:MAG: hypothetical protein U0X71_08255 [Sphingobacteriaceae bacterium]